MLLERERQRGCMVCLERNLRLGFLCVIRQSKSQLFFLIREKKEKRRTTKVRVTSSGKGTAIPAPYCKITGMHSKRSAALISDGTA